MSAVCLPKDITWIGEDDFQGCRIRRVFHSTEAVDTVVATVGSHCLVPHAERAIRVGCIRGVLAFRGDFEDDVIPLYLVPEA